MLVLTIRTDKPQAELGLYDDNEQQVYLVWEAHRELGRTIHARLAELLEAAGKSFEDIQAVVAYEGPGSFTGLRIGLTVANALAASYGWGRVGSSGDQWIPDGIARIMAGESSAIILPAYGAEANITVPRK
jgi:tRNA threonylcarbamoyladenosine biosynthesis protein TsaB